MLIGRKGTACNFGNFPEVAHEAGHLQFASSNCPSIEVAFLLLEQHPLAVTEADDNGHTPIDFWNEHHSPENDEMLATVLFGIKNLHDGNLDQSIALYIVEEFRDIGWWAGVALALDLCPSIAQCLDDIPTSTIPNLLSMLGRSCNKQHCGIQGVSLISSPHIFGACHVGQKWNRSADYFTGDGNVLGTELPPILGLVPFLYFKECLHEGKSVESNNLFSDNNI
eukprot:2322595-Ditylum_brightwellii.AAC.1